VAFAVRRPITLRAALAVRPARERVLVRAIKLAFLGAYAVAVATGCAGTVSADSRPLKQARSRRRGPMPPARAAEPCSSDLVVAEDRAQPLGWRLLVVGHRRRLPRT
jgi:hypothetical protein